MSSSELQEGSRLPRSRQQPKPPTNVKRIGSWTSKSRKVQKQGTRTSSTSSNERESEQGGDVSPSTHSMQLSSKPKAKPKAKKPSPYHVEFQDETMRKLRERLRSRNEAVKTLEHKLVSQKVEWDAHKEMLVQKIMRLEKQLELKRAKEGAEKAQAESREKEASKKAGEEELTGAVFTMASGGTSHAKRGATTLESMKEVPQGFGEGEIAKRKLMEDYARMHRDSLQNTPCNSDEESEGEGDQGFLSQTTTQKDGRIRALIKAEERDNEDFVGEFVVDDDGDSDDDYDDEEPLSPFNHEEVDVIGEAERGGNSKNEISILNPTRKSSIEKSLSRQIAENRDKLERLSTGAINTSNASDFKRVHTIQKLNLNRASMYQEHTSSTPVEIPLFMVEDTNAAEKQRARNKAKSLVPEDGFVFATGQREAGRAKVMQRFLDQDLKGKMEMFGNLFKLQKRMRLYLQASNKMMAHTDAKTAVQSITAEVHNAVKTLISTLYIRDEDTNKLVAVCWSERKKGKSVSELKRILKHPPTISFGDGPVGKAAMLGKTVECPLLEMMEVYAKKCIRDDTISPEVETKTSTLCIPVHDSRGVIIAVMSTSRSAAREGHFRKNEIATLNYVCSVAGRELRKLQLYERSETDRRRNQALLQMISHLGTEDFMAGVTEFVEFVKEAVCAEACSFFLVDEEKNVIKSIAGVQGKQIVLPMGDGIVGHVASNGKIVNIKDAQKDERFFAGVDEERAFVTRCALTAPVFGMADEVFGVIQLLNSDSGAFSRFDENIVRTMALFAGMSLQKSQMYEKTMQSNRVKEAILSVSRAMMDQAPGSTVTDLINGALQSAAEVIGSDKITIFIVDSIKQELWAQFSEDLSGIRVPITHGIVGHVATTGELVNIKDAYADPRFNQGMDKKTGYKTESILCMPVKSHRKGRKAGRRTSVDDSGEVLAVVQAMNKIGRNGKPQPFNEADIEVLGSFCLEAGVMLKHKAMETKYQKVVFDMARERDVLRQKEELAFAKGAIVRRPTINNLELNRRKSLAAPLTNAETFSLLTAYATGKELHVKEKKKLSLTSYFWVFKAVGRMTTVLRQIREFGVKDLPAPGEEGRPGAILRRLNNRRKQVHEAKEQADKLLSRPNHLLTTLARERDLVDLNAFDLTVEVAAEKVNVMCANLNVMDFFSLDRAAFGSIFLTVLQKYRPNVHYHNYRHAFQVSKMMYHMLIDGNIEPSMRPIDKLAMLLAAVGHDVDHPGHGNNHELESRSPLSVLYNDKSILENHHAATLFKIITGIPSNPFKRFSRAAYKDVRSLIVSSILSTDMKLHVQVTKEFSNLKPSDLVTSGTIMQEIKLKLARGMLHACDISAQSLPFHEAELWTTAVCAEFTAEVRKCDLGGLPAAPHMRGLDDLRKQMSLQVNFIDYLVLPLWTHVAILMPSLAPRVKQLHANKAEYQKKLDGTEKKKKEEQEQEEKNKKEKEEKEKEEEEEGNGGEQKEKEDGEQ